MFSDPLVRTLVEFVRSVDIEVLAASSLSRKVFPGLDVQCGAVLVDESRIVHPGDILHEAGHLAVTEPAIRRAERLDPSGGQELAALAWSFAAATHLGLDPAIVFYPESYQGSGDSLIENFASGRYIGVPLLQTWGMSVEPRNAAARGVRPFPQMLRWLR